MTRGIFITVEGGEGVGKSTLIGKLRHAFSASDRELVLTREPGGSDRAEKLRCVLLDQGDASEVMSPETEALIINAARSDHIDTLIRPALDRGAVVLCDRFADSTRAYQGGKIDAGLLEAVIECATRGLEPDLTLLLDGDPEILLARRKFRDGPVDRFELRDLTFHREVRDRFLQISRRHPSRIVVINAEQPVELVLADTVAALNKRFSLSLNAGFGVDRGGLR